MTIRQRRDLSIGEIVSRAEAILRDEGVDALTIRTLAHHCGVTPMARRRDGGTR